MRFSSQPPLLARRSSLEGRQVAVLPFTWSSSPRNVCNITLYGGGRIPQMIFETFLANFRELRYGEVRRILQRVEKLPWFTLSPQIGPQICRCGTFSSPIVVATSSMPTFSTSCLLPRTPVNRPPGNASGPPGSIIDVAIAWEMNASWQDRLSKRSTRL